MRIINRTLSVAVIGIIFSSCQKEIERTVEDDTADPVLIKSVIYLDSTLPTGADTMYKAEFIYDARKRVTSALQVEYDPLNQVRFRYEFFYNGTDKSPYKQTVYQDALAPFYDFFTYDADGYLVKDSAFSSASPNDPTIQKFTTMSPGRFQMVFKQRDLTLGTITDRDSVIYRRMITNENILNGVDSSHHPTLGLSTYDYLFSYDGKTNPFICLAKAYPLLGSYFFYPDGYILPIGKNNATSFSETYKDGSGTDVVSGTINYTYRSDGLPTIGRITGSVSANKVFFSYY